MRTTLIISLTISIVMVVFAFLNNEPIIVNFGFAETQGPIALVLLVTFTLGVLVGVLISFPSKLKQFIHMKSLERSLKKAKQPEPTPTVNDDSEVPFTTQDVPPSTPV